MTPPDRLVQAAAEALWEDGNNRIGYRPWEAVKDAYMAEAGHAIAAAFAALPECEEAMQAVAEEARSRYHCGTCLGGTPCRSVVYNAEHALAALAREFGEPPTPDVERRGDNWPCTDHSTHPPGPCKPPVPKDHRPWG